MGRGPDPARTPAAAWDAVRARSYSGRMPYRVEELAERAGVSVDTVRHYQARGLLPRPRREGRVVVYDEEHVATVRRVRGLRARGLPLDLVARLLQPPSPHEDDDTRLARALVDDAGDVEGDETTPWEGGRLDRGEVAAAAGVSVTLLEALERLGLLRVADERAPYGPVELQAVRDGSTLLQTGVPLSELLALARRYDRAVGEVAEQATELFARYVREPAEARHGGEATDVQIAALHALLPAVGRLAAHHLRSRLVEAAATRLAPEDGAVSGERRAAG